MTEPGTRDPSRNVFLVGSNSLQSRLLATLIRERVGCGCVPRSIDELGELPLGANQLALFDIDGIDVKHIAERLQRITFRAGACAVALMNVDEGVSLEQVVAWPGIKGIFFHRTSQENVVRGIQAIFDGECWLPRKLLSARWEQTTQRRLSPSAKSARLSPKEIETLILLVGGNTNDHIARKLQVSTHTVKSHVYKVFRKLQVSNRVQAVQWAMQHIDRVKVS
jgi:DNA-binding NarL/FixJ family response regulator